ncbi:hypothetical protein [Lederbergia citrea]|uniref:hypothetical protein n=1 Tax=Lederbergia citrea TaxID=2833581 RepID=UPI001BC9C0B8|nr:hypothetical protein [Lederbergia citrea]MBS4176923.1 hypothetical protein [Lederbergia citrea]
MKIKKRFGITILFVIILSGCSSSSNDSKENLDLSDFKPLPANNDIKIIGDGDGFE